MDSQYAILQTVVFERFQGNGSWKALSEKHIVSVGVLRRVYTSWIRNCPDSQLEVSRDVHFTIPAKGRPPALTADEENVIAESVLYYADNNTPLTKNGLRDLVQEFVSCLPPKRQENIGFFDNRPSNKWVTAFLRRTDLKLHHVQMIEDKRANAVTPENLIEHISRVDAAIKRFNIRDPGFIFNMDQSGASFDKMRGRSLRKGIGAAGARLIQKALSTKGNLDRVTVMSVASAAGIAYKPAIVFPGKLASYRKVNGNIQTLHSVLPPCYLFQRNPPGADSNIVFQWAKGFLNETEGLRKNNQRLLLLLDGYGAHIQYQTLKMLKDNNVIVIALPAHTSHITQPLDVCVFSSYKSHLQHELHKAARQKQKLNVFDVGHCISNAYSNSHTAANIRSGFHRTGIWDMELLRPNFLPLQNYLERTNGNNVSRINMQELLERFAKSHRTLLRDADVEENGHVRINTTGGLHLTSDAVINAIRQRHRSEKAKEKQAQAKELAASYKEPKADIQRLIKLSVERSIRRTHLTETRKMRRELRKARAQALRNMVEQGETGASRG